MAKIEGLHFVKKTLKSSGLTYFYVYAWRGGPQVWKVQSKHKPKTIPSDILNKVTEARGRGIQPAAPKTIFSGLLYRYETTAFKNLAPSTQVVWKTWLRRLDHKWGKLILRDIDLPSHVARVERYHESLRATPRAADTMLQVLSRVSSYGIQKRMIKTNPAAAIEPMYKGRREEIIWTYDDLAILAPKIGPHRMIGVLLGATTGLRLEDALHLKHEDVTSMHVIKTTGKGRGKAHAVVERTAGLNAVLMEAQDITGQTTGVIARTVRGGAYKANGFSNNLTAARADVGLQHLHIHDLRGTFATYLIVNGKTNEEVSDIMGWESKKVRRIKAKYVDMQNVVRLREATNATDQEHIIVNQGVNQDFLNPAQVSQLFDLATKKRV